jgi:hypothetical protein
VLCALQVADHSATGSSGLFDSNSIHAFMFAALAPRIKNDLRLFQIFSSSRKESDRKLILNHSDTEFTHLAIWRSSDYFILAKDDRPTWGFVCSQICCQHSEFGQHLVAQRILPFQH